MRGIRRTALQARAEVGRAFLAGADDRVLHAQVVHASQPRVAATFRHAATLKLATAHAVVHDAGDTFAVVAPAEVASIVRRRGDADIAMTAALIAMPAGRDAGSFLRRAHQQRGVAGAVGAASLIEVTTLTGGSGARIGGAGVPERTRVAGSTADIARTAARHDDAFGLLANGCGRWAGVSAAAAVHGIARQVRGGYLSQVARRVVLVAARARRHLRPRRRAACGHHGGDNHGTGGPAHHAAQYGPAACDYFATCHAGEGNLGDEGLSRPS